jgi:dGTPase
VEDALARSAETLAALAPASLAEVQALPAPVIAFSDAVARDIAEIKAFLFARMYRHHRVKRMRVKAIKVVRELFDVFLADPGVMPGEWREAAEAADTQTLRARIVADYIAGMTDRFALEEHRVLTDPFARA